MTGSNADASWEPLPALVAALDALAHADDLPRLELAAQSLVRAGNRASVLQWLRRSPLERPERKVVHGSIVDLYADRSPAIHALLVPGLAQPGRDTVGLVARLVVEAAGESAPLGPPPELSAESWASIEAGLALAWRAIGAPGELPVPRLRLRVPLLAELGLTATGRSLQLPAILAAMSHWCGEALPAAVLATGSFDDDLTTWLAVKERTAEQVRLELGELPLLLASSGSSFSSAQCQDAVDASGRVFGVTPWHPLADVRRIHICTDRQNYPGYVDGPAAAHRLTVPFPFLPEHVTGMLDGLHRLVAGAGRVELTMAGSVAMGAALGWHLHNARETVRYVDNPPDAARQVWWHNRTAPSAPLATPPGPPERPSAAHVLVSTRGDAACPAPWTIHRTGVGPGATVLVPADLRRIVPDVLQRHQGAARLHLAVRGPWQLAAALAQGAHNLVPLSFHEFQGAAAGYGVFFERGRI